MTWLYAGLALVSGALLAVQVGLNNGLRERMSHPLQAALLSFGSGTLALMVVVLALRPPLPRAETVATTPWWAWLGGVVGACYITTTISFSGKLGAAGWLGVVVTGQILTSVLIDHHGLLGFAEHPVSPWRVVGVILLLSGAVLVLKN